jgi:hypothetical protein
MAFFTDECAWAQTSVKVLGRTIKGIRGFGFSKGVEKEHLYAAGDEPIDIQTGNKKYEGNIKLLKYEVDLMNDAAQAAGFADITEVPPAAILITCTFKANPTSALRVVTAISVAFSETKYDMEQNAKMMDVTLPFICMKVVVAKK